MGKGMKIRQAQSRDTSSHDRKWKRKQIQVHRPNQGPASLQGAGGASRTPASGWSRVYTGITRGDVGLDSQGHSPQPAKELETEQNCRLTAVFSEILAKDRKPQKSRLSAPCVSVSTKSQCHHWQTPWSTWAWTGARWPWDPVGEREKWTQKQEKGQNYLLKKVLRQKSNSKNISKSQMLEKR